VGLLSNRVGLLLNGVGLFSNGVGLFSGERVLENTPSPHFEQPLKFIAHGHIFEWLWYYPTLPFIYSNVTALLT